MSSEPISPSSPPAPADEAPRPRASSAALRSEMPILRLLFPFALIALIAVVLGRALGPAIVGVGVGMNRLIGAIDYAGKLTSQVFAMGATVFALGELGAIARSRLPAAFRVGALGLGGVAILVSLLASPRREILPFVMVGVMVFAASVLALLAAWSAVRVPFARPAALVVGLIGLAGLVRLIAVSLAYQATEPRWARLAVGARGVATVSIVLELGAALIATAWIASRARKLASPATLVVLGLALILTRQALHADVDDAGVLSLLLRRTAERLLTRPEPFLPLGLSLFLAFLAPLLASAVLLSGAAPPPRGGAPRPSDIPAVAPVPPAIRAAIALALLVRGAPEMPLSGLLLVIAALGLALASRDERGVWDAINATPQASSPDRRRAS